MKKICFCSVILLSVIALTGCMGPINLAYKNPPPISVKKTHTQKTVSTPKVEDLRGVVPNVIGDIDRVVTGQFGAEYNVTIELDAQQSLREVVRQAFTAALKEANYPIDNTSAHYNLSVKLLKVTPREDEGFIRSTYSCRLQVQVKLTDRQTGEFVWAKTLTGFSKKEGKAFAMSLNDAHDGIRDTFHGALNKIINEMLKSPGFKSAFR